MQEQDKVMHFNTEHFYYLLHVFSNSKEYTVTQLQNFKDLMTLTSCQGEKRNRHIYELDFGGGGAWTRLVSRYV